MSGGDAANVRLRAVTRDDLPALYEQQLDPVANAMAVVYPRDAAAFSAHWEKILADPATAPKVIVLDGAVVGRISAFSMEGVTWIGYWVIREHWGKGIATRALELLLAEVTERPLNARVATTNLGSIRVLEKCGFVITGHRHCPADDRFPECEEAVLRLD